MFKKLFQRKSNIVPDYNPYPYGDGLALRLKALIEGNKIDQVCTILEEMDGGDEWNRRMFYLWYIAKNINRETAEKAPPTIVGEQIRGYHAIEWGWQARGGDRADKVEEGGWEKFYDRLFLGEKHLIHAANLDGNDPCSFPGLIASKQGIGGEFNELVQAYFHEGMSRYPYLVELHDRNIFRLLKKWGGSHEMARNAAQIAIDVAPEGHSMTYVWFVTLIEEWFYHQEFSEEADSKTVAKQFLLDNDRKKEAADIYRKMAGNHTELEIWQISPHNYSAGWFYLSNQKSLLANDLGLLNGRIRDIPWGWIVPSNIRRYSEILRSAYKQADLL